MRKLRSSLIGALLMMKMELRRNIRQKAKTSSVPAHRLIKAFELTGPNELIRDQALEAFAMRFASPLSPQQIEAVRKLTSLDSGPVMAASAQLVAAEGAETMGDAVI